MASFSAGLTLVLSILTVASIAGILVVVYSLYARSGFGVRVKEFIGPKSLGAAFAIALAASIGSLLYSQVIGFPPCELCWFQRIFMYPQAIVFAIALFLKDRNASIYGIVLSIPGALIGLYQSYIQLGGSNSVLPCTAAGAECARVYFLEWGFITIPFMSFIAFVAIIVLMLAYRQTRRTSLLS